MVMEIALMDSALMKRVFRGSVLSKITLYITCTFDFEIDAYLRANRLNVSLLNVMAVGILSLKIYDRGLLVSDHN